MLTRPSGDDAHPAEMKNITRLKNRIEAFAIMTLNIV
ncbi:hypothetical protein Asd1617_01597 [Shigella dysenteriae 1617]|uniref:Uncharacterized protein n=1 Tax=Shigella dysenteriae 1617 TaxID=754093 RepID=A0A0A6ZR77_SHIDY|nr:hypothetical protein Asd1617_01597 [Shigella dysenteriae 1617]